APCYPSSPDPAPRHTTLEAIGWMMDTTVAHECRDQFRRRDVEGWIEHARTGGHVRQFVSPPLFYRNRLTRTRHRVEGRRWRDDVEGDAMAFRGNRHAIGADLVRRVPVGRDAIGADEDQVDLARAQQARGGAVGDHRDWDSGAGELPRRQPGALHQRPGLVGEHFDAAAMLGRHVYGRQRRPYP